MLFSKCHSYKKVTSTNDIAYELAKKGAQEGEYVLAETQTKGRGRMQRKWVSKKGNLYVSLILRPSIATKDISHLTFVAALAVASALEKYLNIAPQLKWPNDVLVDRKKISGILTEMESEGDKVDFMVVGMGINVNQDKFPKSLPNAISLYQVLGKNIEPSQLLEDLLASFEEWYNTYLEKGFSFIKEMWEERSLIKGRAVEVKDGRKKIRGVAVGLDTTGALLIRTPQGETLPVYTGDLVSF